MIMKKLFTKKTAIIGFIFLTAFILSRPSQAYMTVNETAEILPEGFFKFGVAPQLKLSDDSGLNVGVYFDSNLIDDINFRVELGGGKTDFWTQASLKWVPFPDVDRQPAMGIRGAVSYARDDIDYKGSRKNYDFYNIQIAPIISKIADTRYGKMIPFVALPITFVNNKDSSYTASQFAVGAEWFSNRDMHVGAEFDLNLNNSFSSISTFISFPFDNSIGYKK
jgi:hypothetical protein